MSDLAARESAGASPESSLAVLDSNLVHRLDKALAKVGAFGEVRLIVVKGRLRFIQIVQSESISDSAG